MTNKNYCYVCGASMNTNTLSIRHMLSEILARVQQFKGPFHPVKDGNLKSSAYNNFYMLKYWGLVESFYGKNGYYLITKVGRKFLNEEISIPEKLEVFRKRIVGQSKEHVYFSQCKGYGYRKREDYVEDQRSVEPATGLWDENGEEINNA